IQEFPPTACLGLHGLVGDRERLNSWYSWCVPRPSPGRLKVRCRQGRARYQPVDMEFPTGEVKRSYRDALGFDVNIAWTRLPEFEGPALRAQGDQRVRASKGHRRNGVHVHG